MNYIMKNSKKKYLNILWTGLRGSINISDCRLLNSD